MIYILSLTTKKHLKKLFPSQYIHFKVKNIQGLFKDLHRNLRTFPGKNGNIQQQQQYTTMYFVQDP